MSTVLTDSTPEIRDSVIFYAAFDTDPSETYNKPMLIPVLITIVVILCILVVILLAVLLVGNSAQRRELNGQTTAIGLINQQLSDAKLSQEQLSKTVDKNLVASRDSIDKHLLSSKDTINKLHTQLGELGKSSQQMLQVGDEVRRLQDIFKNPKFRGQTGERAPQGPPLALSQRTDYRPLAGKAASGRRSASR